MIQVCRKCGKEAGYSETGYCWTCQTKVNQRIRMENFRALEEATEARRIEAGWPQKRKKDNGKEANPDDGRAKQDEGAPREPGDEVIQ